MKLYSSTLDYLSGLPLVWEWAEAQNILMRAACAHHRDWKLPVLACEAVGGAPEQALPATASIACALIGILFIDDMLDNDPSGEYHRLGEGQTANIASAFMSSAFQAILQCPAQPETKLKALQNMSHMIGTLAFGQYLDVQVVLDEKSYWQVVRTKSAPFFGTALQLGAIFGGASESIIETLGVVGGLYGEMIQIHDDLKDSLDIPAEPDWQPNRSSLPILFAKSVEHPERDRFLELSSDVSDVLVLREAQKILIHCGAISYCADQLLHRYDTARQTLESIEIPHKEPLYSLLEEVIKPIWNLLGNVRV
jgi:geranylgeranyl pyrophosphate synthase